VALCRGGFGPVIKLNGVVVYDIRDFLTAHPTTENPACSGSGASFYYTSHFGDSPFNVFGYLGLGSYPERTNLAITIGPAGSDFALRARNIELSAGTGPTNLIYKLHEGWVGTTGEIRGRQQH
jgi:hypothetical protein